MTSRSKRNFSFGQRLVLAVVPRLVWALLWPIGLTWKFEVIAEEGVTPVVYGEKAGAEIYCFWHQCVLPCTIYFRVSHAVILISQSFDGELITRILRMFGFDAVRGSSSRGGIEGLQSLRRVLESGKTAIFTADGPRGPIYQTKMGPIKLASMSGAPIGAFYLAPQRAWRMKSWDQFLIPKPFTRICVSWAQWTHVALGTPNEKFEAKRLELNASLERARMNATEYFRKNPKEEASPMSGLRVVDFDFHLPEELIAQTPPEVRGRSRMLELRRTSGEVRDGNFSELPNLLNRGDLLVFNDSRVIPARLYAQRTIIREREAPSGQIEVLLTEEISPLEWRVLVKPGRKVQLGERLIFPDVEGSVVLEAEVIARGEFGERSLRFVPVADFFGAVEAIGHMPLPPYIHREDQSDDRTRYQTVYAEERGSVAAPTAGLHFTPQILDELKRKGIETARITLHVGLGTFAPLRVESLNEVQLHEERYTLSDATASAIHCARREGRRIIAVGTTVVRTLEHCALIAPGDAMKAHSGKTQIFISPGFDFRIVGGLLTNFHLPQSSLLMLVSAFAGRENVLAAYKHAVEEKYRFFSYGDCMLIS